MNALYLVDISISKNHMMDASDVQYQTRDHSAGYMIMYYYLMGRYMNVRWVRCEIWVVAFELGAGGVTTNEWYPFGDWIVRSK